jgi:O-antigen/teichoic acid export membrane protein
MVANSVGVLLFPYFSKAASAGDYQFIKEKIEKFERFSFLFIMPVVIFLSLYSDVIIKLVLGNQYLPSIPIMTIINLAMFISVVNMPYGSVLTGMGFFKLAAWISLSNLVLFSFLLILLSNPKMFNLNALGVAFAVLTSQIFVGIINRIYAKKKCSLIDLRIETKYILFGIVNFFSFFFLYAHLSNLYDFRFKIVFVPVYFGITYLALITLGWITKEDLRTVKIIGDVKTLAKYVREEIGKNGHEK